jgi:hypothetical protein
MVPVASAGTSRCEDSFSIGGKVGSLLDRGTSVALIARRCIRCTVETTQGDFRIDGTIRDYLKHLFGHFFLKFGALDLEKLSGVKRWSTVERGHLVGDKSQ